MREISIAELDVLAANAREELWRKAKSVGRDCSIYLHWTAGHYDQKFDDYHINIDGDGRIWLMADLTETLSHTWKRNTGSVGVTLCCAVGGNTVDLGEEPPTETQIEVMSEVICSLADGLWLTIDKKHVMTHGEAADNIDGEWCHEPYGCQSTCERWDLQYLGTDQSPAFVMDYDDPKTGGNILRGKANWYRNERRKQ